MSNPNIIQLSEFDVTQKIIESLSNVCTRAVLFSVKNESKDATQIAEELKISIRSGLHPSYLNDDEIEVLVTAYGEEWYTQFGFKKEDLDEIKVD